MNFSIITKYPLWFIFFCAALGGIYALVLYRKNNKLKEFPINLVRLIAVLRFLTVTILGFLLLSPYIKQLERIVEKPIIIIALDNSESIALTKDSASVTKKYTQQIAELKSELESDFELKLYTFGETLSEDDSLSFDQRQSDISAVLQGVENRFSNRNVGALIIASDGIYTKGSNPLYTSFTANYPVYTLAIGDTSVQRDAQVSKIVANKIAYLGNQFPISIQINASQLKGKKTTLQIFNDGDNVFSAPVEYTSDDFFIDIQAVLEARSVGLQKFLVKLSTVDDEQNTSNNTSTVYLDVLDGREKILLLANAPHPDIAAIKRAIEQNDNYEVSVSLMDKFNGNVDGANLVIYHNLPSKSTDLTKIQQQSEISSLFIVGQQTNINLFNQLSLGVQIQTVGQEYTEATPKANKTFPLFTLSEQTLENVADFPPMVVPFGKVNSSISAYTLLQQKIGGVETESPLWFFLQKENYKTGVIFGEGFWRWALGDYQKNKTREHIEELITKSVQYLSVKADKSLFRVSTENDFLENQPIIFDAQVYNESYELINDGEVGITLTNSKDQSYQFTFSKTSTAYYLNAGRLPADEYRYIAATTSLGKELKETGVLTVLPIQVESLNLRADNQLLTRLSRQHNGATFYLDDADRLIEDLRKRDDIKAISYAQTRLTDLINNKWVFFLLLALLSAEWFIRKRNGSY